MAIYPIYKERQALIIGTGPSLTPDVINMINETPLILKFGVNNTWRVIDLDVFHACNDKYFDLYMSKGLGETRAIKWTSHKHIAEKYEGVFYIPHDDNLKPGLSTDSNYVHRHHGSGPQLINIAFHYGIKTMYLVGWDMRYPGKINRHTYNKPRHFYGDDELSGKHFPMTGDNGEFTGLIKEVETIKPNDYGINIYNCTPDSALTCFPYKDLKGVLNESEPY